MFIKKNLKSNLISAFLLLSIIPLIILSLLSLFFFSRDIEEQVLKQLVSVRDIKRTQIIDYFEGLTVDYCRKVKATHMLRGIRTSADFEYERAIAQINKKMLPSVESVFLLTTPEHTPVNSTIIRDIIRNNGDASLFLPKGIDIKEYL